MRASDVDLTGRAKRPAAQTQHSPKLRRLLASKQAGKRRKEAEAVAEAAAAWAKDLDDERLILWHELQLVLGGQVNRATIWRWERHPDIAFPRRILLGYARIAWRWREVKLWLQAQPRGEPGQYDAEELETAAAE